MVNQVASLTGVFRAAGQMVVTMVITVVTQGVAQFPLAYGPATHTSLGTRRFCWVFTFTSIVGVVLTTWFLRGGRKQGNPVNEAVAEEGPEEILVDESTHP